VESLLQSGMRAPAALAVLVAGLATAHAIRVAPRGVPNMPAPRLDLGADRLVAAIDEELVVLDARSGKVLARRPGRPAGLTIGADGSVWTLGEGGFARLRPGTTKFVELPGAVSRTGWSGARLAPDGASVWVLPAGTGETAVRYEITEDPTKRRVKTLAALAMERAERKDEENTRHLVRLATGEIAGVYLGEVTVWSAKGERTISVPGNDAVLLATDGKELWASTRAGQLLRLSGTTRVDPALAAVQIDTKMPVVHTLDVAAGRVAGILLSEKGNELTAEVAVWTTDGKPVLRIPLPWKTAGLRMPCDISLAATGLAVGCWSRHAVWDLPSGKLRFDKEAPISGL
jgi:hypothetical protein